MNNSIKTFAWKLLSAILNDKQYVCLKYKRIIGERLHIKNPKTYNEKLQWLKIYDHNPFYTMLVDKYLVKQYVASLIGDEYVIPLLAVWDKVEDIDFNVLPDSFVLKTNHTSGDVIICKQKRDCDKERMKAQMSRSMATDYYSINREWPYKNIQRKIIAEKYIENPNGEYLTDYKFFCFDGIPKVVYIGMDRDNNPTTDFFDMDFNWLPIKMRDPHSEIMPQKPDCFEKMKEIAATLSKGIPHVRVDLYYVNNHIYFGEMTFYHCGGYEVVKPDKWNAMMGAWIDLSKVIIRPAISETPQK